MPENRLLIFFPHNPYPPKTGAHLVCKQYLRGFEALGYEILLASTTITTDTPWTAESIAGIESDWKTKVSVFEGDWRERKFIGLTGRLLEMQGRRPAINSPTHSPPRMRMWFHGLIRSFRPSIVMMNYAFWDGLLDGAEGGSLRVMCTHDLVTRNEKLQAALAGSLPPKPLDIDRIDAALLDEGYIESLAIDADPAEYAIYDHYDVTIALSSTEDEAIRRHAPHTSVVRIPPTADSSSIPDNAYSGPPVFVAGSHLLNLIGYAYFARRVLPLVRAQAPDFQIDISGRLQDQITGPDPIGVRFTGFVPEVSELYRDAAFAVVPVFRGTGVAVKVIEAMAHGVTVVALEQTVELDLARHGENCLLARDAAEFAEHVLTLSNDRELCRKLGTQARKDAESYNHENTFEKLSGITRTS